MDKLLYWIKNELIIHLEFYSRYPYVRIGWVWIIVAFFFFHNFSYIFWGIITVVSIYNFINRR
jgi:hypothetical protein